VHDPRRRGSNVAGVVLFVDIAEHHQRLVQISAMSRTFIKDPREMVKIG
jgi:transcriptional accessory protein Tex/SPT6